MSTQSTLQSPTDSLQSAKTERDPDGSAGSRRRDYFGVALAGSVLLLAFLLASFPARNSDLWMHLAAGRDVAHGEVEIGTATGPLSELRVNQTWLYNLAFYALYSTVGGFGLVLVKALLFVALGLTLLRLSRDGAGWWIPGICTALALVAISVSIELQPLVLSYLLLAITLRVLWNESGPDGASVRSLGMLLILFLIWVNVDRWCLVGLAVVGLTWIGQTMDDVRLGDKRSVANRLIGIPLLVLTCTMSPAHVYAFLPPAELGWFSITSPFSRGFLLASPAAFVFAPLLCLGALSFGVSLKDWRWQRFLPWLGLAILSGLHERFVPFFAIVSAPVTARNFTSFFRRTIETASLKKLEWRQAILAGRFLTALSALALLICAWPGWIQRRLPEPPRWAIETPPALQQSAATIDAWRRTGRLAHDSKGLHVSRATASAFSWFCPNEKGVLDRQLVATFRGEAGAATDWAQRMREQGINHVILYDRDRGRLFATLRRLLGDPNQWPVLFLEGDVAVLGWRDPLAAEDPFADWKLSPNRLAFQPKPDKTAPPDAPAERDPRHWSESFWKRNRRPIDRDEALLYLLYAESLRQFSDGRFYRDWAGAQTAALIGAAKDWTGPACLLDAQMRLALLGANSGQTLLGGQAPPTIALDATGFQLGHRQSRDDTPPALLYVAIRAARRAVLVNPNDARAFLVLGECYVRLMKSTRERYWMLQLRELRELRRVQAGAALNRAVVLKPDYAQAHLALASLYWDINFLDLALDHLQAYRDLLGKSNIPAEAHQERFYLESFARVLLRDGRITTEQFREQPLSQVLLTWLRTAVGNRLIAFDRDSAGLRIADRAQLARQRGLAGQARDLLLSSHKSAFGSRGVAEELQLLLYSGRSDDVANWTDAEHRADLGAPAYHWLRVQAYAARGNYRLAKQECAQLIRTVRPEGERSNSGYRALLSHSIAQTLLDQHPIGRTLFDVAHLRKDSYRVFTTGIARLNASRREVADVNVVLGLLALEEGQISDAAMAFHSALDVTGGAKDGARIGFDGRRVAEQCLQWIYPNQP